MSKIIRLNEKDFHKLIKESVKRILKEEYYPDDDDMMDDYYYGAMMTLTCSTYDMSDQVVNALTSVKDENIESENSYCSVLVKNVELTPDNFDGYDININVAVSAPEMPISAIEEDVIDQIWYWLEDKTGERFINIEIVSEEEVFDRRVKYKRK